MYYPEDLIEEIRAKNDIVDVISGYVRLQKKGASYFGLCPFHNEGMLSPHDYLILLLTPLDTQIQFYFPTLCC